MWEAQVAKAQWKAPCAAQGRMECTAGHKLKMEPAIICDKKVHYFISFYVPFIISHFSDQS